MNTHVDRGASVVYLTEFARPWLDDADVTEVSVNRAGEIWALRNGVWERHLLPELKYAQLDSVATAVAKYVSNDINDVRPILSALLTNGERIQVVVPPACEQGTISLTIRKPSPVLITMEEYRKTGFFDSIKPVAVELGDDDKELMQLLKENQAYQFLARAVGVGKTIVIAGETNSGKTTLMKALMQQIATTERIITVEDVSELFLPNHPNHVHLFYQAALKSEGSAEVTATDLLKCSLRMNPDRIMLAELRGGETYDFLNIAASGHGGSMTSVHAGTCALAFERMALMVLQSPQGQALPYEVIRRLLVQVVDVVVHVNYGPTGRHISGIWFDPESKLTKS